MQPAHIWKRYKEGTITYFSTAEDTQKSAEKLCISHNSHSTIVFMHGIIWIC